MLFLLYVHPLVQVIKSYYDLFQAEGYVIGSCIKHIPIAGRDITYFIQQLLRERESGIPPEQSLEVAKTIKEKFGYICPDIAKEFNKYDTQPDKFFKTHEGANHITKQVSPVSNTSLTSTTLPFAFCSVSKQTWVMRDFWGLKYFSIRSFQILILQHLFLKLLIMSYRIVQLMSGDRYTRWALIRLIFRYF